MIIDVFYKPLTAFLKMGRPIVSQQEIRTMFSFVEVILKVCRQFSLTRMCFDALCFFSSLSCV